jgi:hypothetical protein
MTLMTLMTLINRFIGQSFCLAAPLVNDRFFLEARGSIPSLVEENTFYTYLIWLPVDDSTYIVEIGRQNS